MWIGETKTSLWVIYEIVQKMIRIEFEKGTGFLVQDKVFHAFWTL